MYFYQWLASPSDAKSACTSGSRCNASISSICTRRCSECRDRPDLFDLLDFVDREDLALFVLFARDRVDCLCNRFWLIVRCKFLLLELAAMLVIHGCLTASSARILSAGEITRHRSMKFLARSDTSFQCWKYTDKKIWNKMTGLWHVHVHTCIYIQHVQTHVPFPICSHKASRLTAMNFELNFRTAEACTLGKLNAKKMHKTPNHCRRQ